MRSYEMRLKNRYTELKRLLILAKKDGRKIEKEKFIAEMCINWTVSRRYAQDKLNCLVTSELVREEDVEGKKVLIWND